MKFKELNKLIPKGSEGEKHEHTLNLAAAPGWGVRVRYPGKYGPNDYVVEVTDTDKGWTNKQIRHDHLFYDFEEKLNADREWTIQTFLPDLLKIIRGEDEPGPFPTPYGIPGIQVPAFEFATQALAVCEYRRLPSGDPKGGGRYLPINFIVAIALGKWTAGEAAAQMRYGRPAIERLNFPLFSSLKRDVDGYIEKVF